MEELTKYLEGLETRFQGAENFVVTETPLLIQEFLLWNWWSNFIYAIAYIISVLPLIYLAYIAISNLRRSKKQGKDIDAGAYAFTIGFPLILSFLLLFYSINKILTCTKISVAPRVFVVEKAAELFNGVETE